MQASTEVVLSFGGVFRSLHLFVNGEATGTHYGYMDSFELDITRHAQTAVAQASAGVGSGMLNITARVSGGNNATFSGDDLGGCFDMNDGNGETPSKPCDLAVSRLKHCLCLVFLLLSWLRHSCRRCLDGNLG